MNSIKRFKNLMSILFLYAQNIIVHDKTVITQRRTVSEMNKRITGSSFLRLTTSEKV